MEHWRTILLIATVVGFVVTVVGLVSAYAAARREHRESGKRIELLRVIDADEDAALDAVPDDAPDRTERLAAIGQEYQGKYDEHGLVRVTYDNLIYIAQYESQRLLGMVMAETRRDFVVAGVGLLVSTIASAGSLYLAGS